MKRKKQIFTLVELLITIAIIAILAGMLLPALNSAREKAGTISCLARQKQVNLTLSMYADANDDYLPPRGGHGEYADIDWLDMLKNFINVETKKQRHFPVSCASAKQRTLQCRRPALAILRAQYLGNRERQHS